MHIMKSEIRLVKVFNIQDQYAMKENKTGRFRSLLGEPRGNQVHKFALCLRVKTKPYRITQVQWYNHILNHYYINC